MARENTAARPAGMRPDFTDPAPLANPLSGSFTSSVFTGSSVVLVVGRARMMVWDTRALNEVMLLGRRLPRSELRLAVGTPIVLVFVAEGPEDESMVRETTGKFGTAAQVSR